MGICASTDEDAKIKYILAYSPPTINRPPSKATKNTANNSGISTPIMNDSLFHNRGNDDFYQSTLNPSLQSALFTSARKSMQDQLPINEGDSLEDVDMVNT